MNVRFQGIAYFRGFDADKVRTRMETFLYDLYDRGEEDTLTWSDSPDPVAADLSRRVSYPPMYTEGMVLSGVDAWRFLQDKLGVAYDPAWHQDEAQITVARRQASTKALCMDHETFTSHIRAFYRESLRKPGVEIYQEQLPSETPPQKGQAWMMA